MKYEIYTDGACSVKKRFGGYAAIAKFDDQQIVVHSNKKNATNNEMELLAVISILQIIVTRLNEDDIIFVHSDSAYVVNAVNQGWIQNWIDNKWRTRENEPVANKNAWQKLFWLLNSIRRQKCNYEFVKVKGHSDCKLNNYVDRLAVRETQILKEKQLED